MLLPGEVTATAWLPTCDVVSARQCSYPVSTLSGVHLPGKSTGSVLTACICVQRLFRTAVIAMPFVGQRSASSRETVVKLCHWQSSDDASWSELPTREVTCDDVKVCFQFSVLFFKKQTVKPL